MIAAQIGPTTEKMVAEETWALTDESLPDIRKCTSGDTRIGVCSRLYEVVERALSDSICQEKVDKTLDRHIASCSTPEMLPTKIAERFSPPTLSWHRLLRSPHAERAKLPRRKASSPRTKNIWPPSYSTKLQKTPRRSWWHILAVETQQSAPLRQTKTIVGLAVIAQSITLVFTVLFSVKEMLEKICRNQVIWSSRTSRPLILSPIRSPSNIVIKRLQVQGRRIQRSKPVEKPIWRFNRQSHTH